MVVKLPSTSFPCASNSVGKDGQLLRLYVDGNELARKAAARQQLSRSNTFLVGINNGTDGPVLADVDEVAVYGKELGADRVLAHYQAGARP